MRLTAERDATRQIVTVDWQAHDPQLRHYLSLNLQEPWLPLCYSCEKREVCRRPSRYWPLSPLR